MKNILLLAIFVMAILPAFAQEQQVLVPQLSPLEKVEADIGISKIRLTYSRPSMRGRKIFGGLVPYDQLWRTGANVNTQISLQDPVKMAEQSVPAGTYSLFSIPGQSTWTFYLYSELGEYGAPESLDEDKIIAQFGVKSQSMTRTIESLAIGFDQHRPNGVHLVVAWENTYVEIPIEVNTETLAKQRLAQSTQTLADDYASTAWIYYRDLKDIEQALTMIEKSIKLRQDGKDFETWLASLDPNHYNLPWRHLAKSEMLAELGQYEQALAAAKLSLTIAEFVKDESYVKSNQENIKKWEAELKP
ncbi:MAG: DUF2911 domain-containing protein [Bacteroidota bacterium]